MTSIFGNMSTAVLPVPSGRFIVVGSVPGSCMENGKQKSFPTEQEALDAILADPWIIANPGQLVQRADCSHVDRSAPRTEQTEAGIQVVIADTPARAIPNKKLSTQRRQSEAPLELECAEIDAKQGKLF